MHRRMHLSRTLNRGIGTALTLAAVSLALLPGVASAAEPRTTQQADNTCDPGDVCVFSQDGRQQLIFDQPTGQMPDLFRYTPGPGPTGSWANGVYRMFNRTGVTVYLQDIDNHPPTIIGEVAPGQDVSVPQLPALIQADRLLINL